MFHLKAGVHFNEIELAIFIKELDRAGIAIPHANHGIGNRGADPFAFFRRQGRRRSLFKHFLVTTLQGAIAFKQVNGVTMHVTNDLQFDVARFAKILFHVNGGIAKVLQCFLTGHGKCLGKILFALNDFHAATTAAA